MSTKYKVGTTGRSFRLGLDSTADSEDTFTLTRNIAVTATSNLTFQKRRRRMLNTNYIHAEVSTDNGTSWTSLWNQPGLGTSTSSATADSAFSLQTVSLASYAGQTIRVRFAFRKAPSAGAILAADTGAATLIDTGVWIDDVTVTNSTNLSPLTRTALPGTATSFRFDAAAAGETPVAGASYRVRLRAVNAGVPGPWGEPLVVVPTATPLTGFAAWEAYDYPMISGVPFDADTDEDGMPNGFEYAFSLNPVLRQTPADFAAFDQASGTFSLSRPLPVVRAGVTYGAEWSPDLKTWSSAGLTVTTTGGQARAVVPASWGNVFLRWKILKN